MTEVSNIVAAASKRHFCPRAARTRNLFRSNLSSRCHPDASLTIRREKGNLIRSKRRNVVLEHNAVRSEADRPQSARCRFFFGAWTPNAIFRSPGMCQRSQMTRPNVSHWPQHALDID